MSVLKPALLVTGAALVLAAGCALPAVAAPASHVAHTRATTGSHHVVAAHRTAAKPAGEARPATTTRTTPTAKPTHAVTKKKAHAAAKKTHAVTKKTRTTRSVVERTTVTVHGVAGAVTLTKTRSRGAFELSVAGHDWTGIDLGTNRDQAVFSWLRTHPSFDTAHHLATALEHRFPGTTAKLPVDLVLLSSAL